jgi:tRNA pseudouridine38-40 synthase
VVDDAFHAQYGAVSKEYHYYILNREDPSAIGALFQWHIRQLLDIEPMKKCCQEIMGVHDFRSFENTGSPRSTTIREVILSEIHHLEESRLVFIIRANGFLKYMVRNLIGTIVLAGQKKISAQEFKDILSAKDRTKAGPTAPPHGLFLKQVHYF